MTELEKRKRMLVVESEMYRQLLKLEFQNFRIYGRYARSKVTHFRSYASLLTLAVSIGRSLLTQKEKSPWRRAGSMFWMGWRGYNRVAPLVRRMFSGRNS